MTFAALSILAVACSDNAASSTGGTETAKGGAVGATDGSTGAATGGSAGGRTTGTGGTTSKGTGGTTGGAGGSTGTGTAVGGAGGGYPLGNPAVPSAGCGKALSTFKSGSKSWDIDLTWKFITQF